MHSCADADVGLTAWRHENAERWRTCQGDDPAPRYWDASRNCHPDPTLAVPTLGAFGSRRQPRAHHRDLRRLCPFCNGEAVKEARHRSVVNGTLKSPYHCQVCDVPFLWVRLVESPWP